MPFCEIIWKNLVQPDMPQRAMYEVVRFMRCAYWVIKFINKHSESEIFIAFPLLQWIYESTSMLHLYVRMPVFLTLALLSQLS